MSRKQQRQDRRQQRQDRKANARAARADRRERKKAALTRAERKERRLALREQRQADKQEFRLSENFAERAKGRNAAATSLAQNAAGMVSAVRGGGGGGAAFEPLPQASAAADRSFSPNSGTGNMPNNNTLLLGAVAVVAIGGFIYLQTQKQK